METKNTFLETPVGDVIFASLAKPTDEYGKNLYVIKLVLDESNPGVAEFKNQLQQINPRRIASAKDENGNVLPGKFQVKFTSIHAPKLKSVDGNKILAEELAPLKKGGKATASVVVSMSTRGNLPAGVKATMYMDKVVLHSWIPEDLVDLKQA